jgi:hypothetical protein
MCILSHRVVELEARGQNVVVSSHILNAKLYTPSDLFQSTKVAEIAIIRERGEKILISFCWMLCLEAGKSCRVLCLECLLAGKD